MGIVLVASWLVMLVFLIFADTRLTNFVAGAHCHYWVEEKLGTPHSRKLLDKVLRKSGLRNLHFHNPRVGMMSKPNSSPALDGSTSANLNGSDFADTLSGGEQLRPDALREWACSRLETEDLASCSMPESGCRT